MIGIDLHDEDKLSSLNYTAIKKYINDNQSRFIDELIEILKIILNKHNFSDFHCYIIGDGPVREKMINLACEMGLEKFISFLS